MPEGRTEDRGTVPPPPRARDWDYPDGGIRPLVDRRGWNNVINMIPARDSEESSRFSRKTVDGFARGSIECGEQGHLRHLSPFSGRRPSVRRRTSAIL